VKESPDAVFTRALAYPKLLCNGCLTCSPPFCGTEYTRYTCFRFCMNLLADRDPAVSSRSSGWRAAHRPLPRGLCPALGNAAPRTSTLPFTRCCEKVASRREIATPVFASPSFRTNSRANLDSSRIRFCTAWTATLTSPSVEHPEPSALAADPVDCLATIRRLGLPELSANHQGEPT